VQLNEFWTVKCGISFTKISQRQDIGTEAPGFSWTGPGFGLRSQDFNYSQRGSRKTKRQECNSDLKWKNVKKNI
jgi:hypothetical protein